MKKVDLALAYTPVSFTMGDVNGKLPWARLPLDMENLNSFCRGRDIIMGFNTFKSLPPRSFILKQGFIHIVTRNNYKEPSIEDILVNGGYIPLYYKDLATAISSAPNPVVIGGSTLIESLMGLIKRGLVAINKAYITEVNEKLLISPNKSRIYLGRNTQKFLINAPILEVRLLPSDNFTYSSIDCYDLESQKRIWKKPFQAYPR